MKLERKAQQSQLLFPGSVNPAGLDPNEDGVQLDSHVFLKPSVSLLIQSSVVIPLTYDPKIHVPQGFVLNICFQCYSKHLCEPQTGDYGSEINQHNSIYPLDCYYRN